MHTSILVEPFGIIRSLLDPFGYNKTTGHFMRFAFYRQVLVTSG